MTGRAAFRELEERVTLELLDDPERADACARRRRGGLVDESARRCNGTRVVWLDVELDQAWERVGSSGGVRPLARDQERFAQLFEQRRPHV